MICTKCIHSSKDYMKLNCLAFVVMFCAFGGIGYQYSIVNEPRPIIIKFIHDNMVARHGEQLSEEQMAFLFSMMVACQGIGALVGALVGKYTAEHLGRHPTVMVIIPVCQIVGSVLMMIAKPLDRFELIMAGRLVFGLSTGLSYATVAMFCLECTPIRHRGTMGSLAFLTLLIGEGIGRVVSLAANDDTWSYCMGGTVVFGVVLLAAGPCFHESPKFLLLKHNNEERAKEAIAFYFGMHRVDSRIIKFRLEESGPYAHVSYREMAMHRIYRTPILLALVINAAAAAGGLYAMFSYSSSIFEQLSLTEDERILMSQLLIPVNLVSGVLQTLIVSRVRRRSLVLFCLSVVIICHCWFLACALVDKYVGSPSAAYVACASMLIALFALNTGVASVSIFLPSEITLLPARSLASSIGGITRCCGILITQMTFHIMNHLMGAYVFIFFIVFCSVCLIYLVIELPETKGRSLDQIVSKWRGQTMLRSDQRATVKIIAVNGFDSSAYGTGDGTLNEERRSGKGSDVDTFSVRGSIAFSVVYGSNMSLVTNNSSSKQVLSK